MNFLEPESDRAVRMGVDAFIDGRLRPVVAGDTVFETKNSRYRMRDGVIIAATDGRLIGSELVGWLAEENPTDLDPRWFAGARAVLLDRRFGRHIVVTSATLMMEIEGVLAEGSDSRPVPSKNKTSRPAGFSISPSTPGMPAIPKPAGVPRWTEMAVSDVPENELESSMSGAPSLPITPSTPPPRGPVSAPPPRPTPPPVRPLGAPPAPPGRTSAGG